MSVQGAEESRVAKVLSIFAMENVDIKCLEDMVGPLAGVFP